MGASTATPEDVAADLALAVHLGLIEPGGPFPSGAEISAAYGVPQPTVAAALQRLEILGLARPGPVPAAAATGSPAHHLLAGAALCRRLREQPADATAAAWTANMGPGDVQRALVELGDSFLRASRPALRGQPADEDTAGRAARLLDAGARLVASSLPWSRPGAGGPGLSLAAAAWPAPPRPGRPPAAGASWSARRRPGTSAGPARAPRNV